jgi:membrane-associated protease RseP (regulator of RpoE activity)
VLATLLILLAYYTACNILFSLAQAIAGIFLGATLEEINLFFGKELVRFAYRGVVIKIGCVPSGCSVKFAGEKRPNAFGDLHPFRRMAILAAGPASLLALAVLCLGPADADAKVGRGCVQFVLPIVPRATAWAGGTPKELVERLLTLLHDQPSRVVLGIVASKLVAINLLPIPPLCGGQILMILVGWRKGLPEPATVNLIVVGMLITFGLQCYWFVLIAYFAWKGS